VSAIRLLSEQLINRIAAGEVVERPASVLKELLENSLDAGATRIEVLAEGGGRRLVRVADNGCGLEGDDLLLAVERHATSKLDEDTDLMSIATLGFRGEALPSIGAVSRLTIASAVRADGHGRRIRLSGGRVLAVEDAPRDKGTTVDVADLFFNVPARRKFLRNPETEAAHLAETVQRYALGRPEVRLVYRHNETTVLATNPREDPLSRVARVLGRETARRMNPFEGRVGGVALSGFLGLPDLTRSRPSAVYLYVNGRPVQDRLLLRVVHEAYHGRIPSGRFPCAIVFLGLDPAAVDVNVHPAKAHVRFRQPGQVLEAAAAVLAEALAAHRPKPLFHPAADVPRLYPLRPASPGTPAVAEAWTWVAEPDAPVAPPVSAPETWPELANQAGPADLFAIGQLYRTYILAQGTDGLYIVDQHAAHERVLFERFEDELARGRLSSQPLLLPLVLEMGPVQAAALETLRPDLDRLGFELEPFGGQTFVLKAVPAVLAGRNAEQAISEIADQADEPGVKPDRASALIKLLSTLACHASVRAGDELGREEMDRLLADLGRTRLPTHCPHGRPLIFHLAARDIEKRFQRG